MKKLPPICIIAMMPGLRLPATMLDTRTVVFDGSSYLFSWVQLLDKAYGHVAKLSARNTTRTEAGFTAS